MIIGNEKIHPLTEYAVKNGLTIRQFYAGLALQGLRASKLMLSDTRIWTSVEVARQAKADAEALIAELNKTEKP